MEQLYIAPHITFSNSLQLGVGGGGDGDVDEMMMTMMLEGGGATQRRLQQYISPTAPRVAIFLSFFSCFTSGRSLITK
jgi:hypothetical protein